MVEFELLHPEAGAASSPELDPTQQAVVDHPGGPLLVLAGPGTGKTTTLIELVARRIESGRLNPDQILVLTFSRKAAAELRARIAARTPDAGGQVTATTFHSFCYALVREFSDPVAFTSPPELLTAPQRDAMWAELLAGHSAESWPEHLRPALGTRGFAAEVQTFLDQLAVLGLDTVDLRRIAIERNRPDWTRIAEAIDEYHDVLDLQNLADYSDLIVKAVRMSSRPDNRELLRSRYRLVVVDEYQDTDPLQTQLLQELAGDGHDLVVVGDHDQSIYGFRGADVRGIFEFPRRFATAQGEAPVVALGHTRRFGARILEASRQIIAPNGTPGGLPGEVLQQHRQLSSSAPQPGEVFVERFVSAAAEADHIAALLRRAHLEQKRPWADMAVLVRTGSDIARLQNALIPAGVPVEVTGDEVPLVAESAVRSLLLALELADHIASGRPVESEQAEALLTGPLAELDAAAMRRLKRALRRRDRDTASDRLVAEAVSEPVMLGVPAHDGPTQRAIAEAERVVRVVHRAAGQIGAGEPPEQALWTLWEGSGWPKRLLAQWELGSDARAGADRDLDAVVALFDHAAKLEETGRRRSVPNFIADLRAQQIPADQISSAHVRPDAVRLMTAHRAKGLQWPLVVVAGVQEDTWPDVRFHGSLLQPELLTSDAPPSRRDRLREERRLFYVACTRAAEQLVVTCVDGPAEDSDTPSRFVTELLDAGFGRRADEAPRPRLPRPVSLRGVVTELRMVAESGEADRADEASALLAQLTASGLRSVAAADPQRWWGTVDLTASETPVRPVDEPVGLSASQVESITTCPLKWFLSHEARAATPSSNAQAFGSVIHALVADVVERDVDPNPTQLKARLDEVWPRLAFEADWIAERERLAAHEAIDRFVAWHRANPEQREVLAAEHRFKLTVDVDGDQAQFIGSIDRIERDGEGRLHAVDFKTGKQAPSAEEIAQHAQLGIYQYMIDNGACADLAPGASAGGAELVHLRQQAGKNQPDFPKVQMQDAPAADAPFFAERLTAEAVSTVRREVFAAVEHDCERCDFRRVCPAQSGVAVGGELS